jgi:hypothetical protein
MTSKSVAQLLENLTIGKSHNRPYTSNDNPFSEAHFKTLKYRPEFPQKFNSLKEAELFSQDFFCWYNHHHYHSNLVGLTPGSVHYGQANHLLNKRYQTLLKAYLKNPIRFNNKPPQLKQLPIAVYINPPQTVDINVQDSENFSGQENDILVA